MFKFIKRSHSSQIQIYIDIKKIKKLTKKINEIKATTIKTDLIVFEDKSSLYSTKTQQYPATWTSPTTEPPTYGLTIHKELYRTCGLFIHV